MIALEHAGTALARARAARDRAYRRLMLLVMRQQPPRIPTLIATVSHVAAERELYAAIQRFSRWHAAYHRISRDRRILDDRGGKTPSMKGSWL